MTDTVTTPVNVRQFNSSTPLPSGASLLSQGEIVSIDRVNRHITVRDFQTRQVRRFRINDQNAFTGLDHGQNVQIFNNTNSSS